MPKISLGVDIGLRYIKLVYASGIGEKMKILKYSLIDTPEECCNDDEIINPVAIGRLIQKDIIKSGLTPAHFSLCMNEKAVTVREIHLSNIKKEELVSAISFELSQIYPGIMGTSTVTYKVYSMQNGMMNGISAFCQNKVLSSYIQMGNAVGLKLKNIDVNSNAVVKAVRQFSPQVIRDKTVLLVDIGENSSNISFVLNENLLLSRVVNAGLSNVYQIIADSLNITITMAKEAYNKKTLDTLGVTENDLQGYMRQCYLPIEQQINQTLEFCRYTYPNNPINDIYLLGGGGLFSGFPEYLTDTFNIPTSRIFSDKLKEQMPPDAFMLFLPALGSLFYEEKKDIPDLNFVSSVQKTKLKQKNSGALIVTFAVFIFVTLVIGSYYLFLDFDDKKLLLEETELNNKIASYSELATVKKEFNDSQERIAVLSTVEELSVVTALSTSNLLNVMAKMLPDEVFAISVSVSGDKVLNLNGKSSTREAVAYFINNLIGNELFSEVQLSSVVSASMQNDTAVDYNFVISLKVTK